jgi:serpin B
LVRVTRRRFVRIDVMRRALAAALILGALVLPASGAARSSTAQSSSAARAENAFALSLLHGLGAGGNLVYSPYSIDLALTMSGAGAAGQTASQIAHVLGAPSPGAAVADAALLRRELTQSVGSGTGAPTLDVANALWTQSGLSLQQPFVSTLTSDFGAPPQSTNFASSPAAALAAINSWVSSHTDSLIPAILGPGSITPQTAFVLANAIYLKAHWEMPFEADLTQPARFTTTDGRAPEVPFMNQRATRYSYASGRDYKAIELPYSSSSLSLLAILPKAGSFDRFQRSLNTARLDSIIASLSPASVNLAIPKLDLATQTSLNGTLEKLGMTDAFTGGANFSAITTQRRLYISLVEHAAVLKLDEQGTVAAGATVVVGPTAAVPVQTRAVNMVLNHPFLLFLRDDASGAILFVARVADPAQN